MFEQKNNEDCSPVTELHPVYRLQQDVSDGREHGLQFKLSLYLMVFIYSLSNTSMTNDMSLDILGKPGH